MKCNEDGGDVVFALVLFLGHMTGISANEIPENYYRFGNVHSGQYLDYEGGYSGANVYQKEYPYYYVTPEKFKIVRDKDNYFTISPEGYENLALDVYNGSSECGANIWLYTKNNTDAQKFKFYSNGDGTFRIASKCSGDNMVVTVQYASLVSGANVFQYVYNATQNDQWVLEAAIEDGAYLIRNKITGLYLSANSDSYYIYQKERDASASQVFKITSSSAGYYDIAPLFDLGYSVSVSGWDLGMDYEGNNVVVMPGQSSEGQRWKFFVNADGSYRIVSELSNCMGAITSDGSTYLDLRSHRYSQSLNANWELIQLDPVEKYQKEGRNVIVDIDTEKYLQPSITAENLTKFINHLDDAYDKYYELVGKKPKNGSKIRIVVADAEPGGLENKAVLWAMPNDNTIYWYKKYVHNGLYEANNEDGWSFGLLHEMGHLFDYDRRWEFDSEFSANFKMAYVLYKLNGQYAMHINGNLINSYSSLENYYKSLSATAYTRTLGAAPMTYANDGLTYMFLDVIGDDWNAVRLAYRDYLNLQQCPTDKSGMYEKFLELINKNSADSSFLRKYNAKYKAQSDYAKSANFIVYDTYAQRQSMGYEFQ